MSTKPSTLPEWNTGGANRTTPSPTRKVLGWLLGERPAGSYFNFLFYWIFKWIEYLKDGAFSGNHSIAGDLAVTGNLAVTGAITGTGILKHTDKVRTLAAHAMAYDSGWQLAVGGIESTASDVARATIPFDVGDRVKSFTVALKGNVATTGDFNVEVFSVSKLGVATSIGSSLVNNQANSWADTTVNVTDTTITDDVAILVTISANASGLTVGNMRFTYDRPS